jgi:methionine-rich copper-binding protein CopC
MRPALRRHARWAVAAAMIALSSVSSPADAHAMLTRAAPAVGSALAAPPAASRLEFTAEVLARLSRIGVRDDAGRPVETGPLESSAGAPRVLEAKFPARLAPGAYRVDWRVVSADGHVTAGDFRFVVRP